MILLGPFAGVGSPLFGKKLVWALGGVMGTIFGCPLFGRIVGGCTLGVKTLGCPVVMIAGCPVVRMFGCPGGMMFGCPLFGNPELKLFGGNCVIGSVVIVLGNPNGCCC